MCMIGMILTAPNIWNKCLSGQPSTEHLHCENHQNYLHHPRDYHIITVVMPWHQSSSRTWPSRLNIRQNRSAPAATVEQCTAVIWLGIIRPAFEFPMCVPGQPASLASKHWLIHCVSAQTGRSISPPLDQAGNGILKNILLFSWAHLWYVSLRELLSLREDIKRNVSFFRALPKLGGWGVWP